MVKWCLYYFMWLSFRTLSVNGLISTDVPCVWNSFSGANFDLRQLTAGPKQESYFINDGDIPCTTEVEPTYSFVWNFCAEVTNVSRPAVCKPYQIGSAIQYLVRDDGYTECNVIGHYDSMQDDTHFSLLNANDPSKGVSMTYPLGDKCPGGALRSATVDLQCANTHMEVVSALEPSTCNYHMVAKSYYGCPTECPVTEKGLCDSHGYCFYDTAAKQAHCFCNEGRHGHDCSGAPHSHTGHTSGWFQVEFGLLLTLLLVALGLIGVVGRMVFIITKDRKLQLESYSQLSTSQHGSGMELSNHI